MDKVQILQRVIGLNEEINDINIKIEKLGSVDPVHNLLSYAKASFIMKKQTTLIKKRDELEKLLDV